ncbi:hypothetical protein ABFB09_04480 [Dehalogenimonas sp. THU2]|uniref:hypothetical protein n=1 Tax=Dehalogenimonas sp. THU2 TaxID=3151121 RepID=UPI003218A1F6
MGDIRSAREIALDKLKDMDEITPEDRLRWKFVPAGEKLVQRYMVDGIDLEEEFAKFTEEQLPYVKQGLVPGLVAILNLPRDESAEKRNLKVMAGIMETKDDKESVAGAFGQLQQIFDHYHQMGEQQRQQAYQGLKARYEQRLRQAMKEQQGGADYTGPVNVEQYPQFQEEWRHTQTKLELQYAASIDKIKKYLIEVA